MTQPRLIIPALLARSAAEFGQHTSLDLIENERATGIVGWPAFTQRLREHPSFASRDLLIRGIVMAGYNKHERSETFDENGWCHTPDQVYRNDNNTRLFYVGRTSELIKAAGANVSPLEVEAVIAQFDDVAQWVVVGLDDPQRDGVGGATINGGSIANVVPYSGQE